MLVSNRLVPITTKDRVSAMIKDALLSGQLKPGERIVELQLAKSLGLATTSIREALFELERQGYVMRVANKGTYVSEMSSEEIQQIYRVRSVLEVLAVELMKGRTTPGDFAQLQELVDQMKAAAQAGNLQTFYTHDLQFHSTIWRLSGNRYIVQFLDSTVRPLFAFYVARLKRTVQQLIGDAERHQQLLDAIRTQSVAVARRAMEAALLQYFWEADMGSEAPDGSKTKKKSKGRRFM